MLRPFGHELKTEQQHDTDRTGDDSRPQQPLRLHLRAGKHGEQQQQKRRSRSERVAPVKQSPPIQMCSGKAMVGQHGEEFVERGNPFQLFLELRVLFKRLGQTFWNRRIGQHDGQRERQHGECQHPVQVVPPTAGRVV